jgi:hypothetical protein
MLLRWIEKRLLDYVLELVNARDFFAGSRWLSSRRLDGLYIFFFSLIGAWGRTRTGDAAFMVDQSVIHMQVTWVVYIDDIHI